jgi:8-oxo-dGTP pyrophosphatase MutT (NUDIX family)
VTDYNTQTPHLASFVILKNPAGKIAMVLRTGTGWMDGHFGLPSGKVENCEMYKAAAVREAFEEVGAVIDQRDLKHAITQHYLETKYPENSWVNVLFLVEKWTGELVNKEKDKHGNISWFEPEALPENTVPAVRQALEEYANGKNYCEFQWEE